MRNIYKFHEFQEALISQHSPFDGIFFFFLKLFILDIFKHTQK